MDAMYLSNVLDPRYKRAIIESNLLQRDAKNILQMCLNKVEKMNDILEKAFVEDSGKHPGDR
jgi:hypothetical protein